MNTPPAYSRSGYLHRIAMSYKKKLFIVVEGKGHDRYFVDRLCRSSPKLGNDDFEIVLVEQIGRGRNPNSITRCYLSNLDTSAPDLVYLREMFEALV